MILFQLCQLFIRATFYEQDIKMKYLRVNEQIEREKNWKTLFLTICSHIPINL